MPPQVGQSVNLYARKVTQLALTKCGNKKIIDDAAGWEITEGRQRAKQFRRVARQKRARSICTWVSDTGSETALIYSPCMRDRAARQPLHRSP